VKKIYFIFLLLCLLNIILMNACSDGYDNGGGGGGEATTGDSATAFFDAGTIEHERGGLEADVNAYSGLVAISGGSTSEVDSKSELEAQIADVSDFYMADGDSLTGVHDFGGATSLELPNGASPTIDTDGEIGFDTDIITQGMLLGYINSSQIYMVGTSDTPSDNEIPKYDSASGTITWESDATGAGSGAFDDTSDPVVLNTTTKDVVVGAAQKNSAKFTIDGDADQVQLCVQAHSTQTSYVFLLENSDGIDGFFIDGDGRVASISGYDGVGAVDIDYGSADITDHTFVTDGTGTAEFVIPAGSIDSTEILDDTIANADINSSAAIAMSKTAFVAGTNCTLSTNTLNVDDAFLLNNGDIGTGTYDFGGADDFEIPNGADPTIDTAGQIAIVTAATISGAMRIYTSASAYNIPVADVKSFVIDTPTTASDYPLIKFPYAITIHSINVLVEGGTNVVGGLDEADGDGDNAVAIDSDITGTAGSNVADDGSLSNPSVDANDWLLWHTTSQSGDPDSISVTFTYTVDA